MKEKFMRITLLLVLVFAFAKSQAMSIDWTGNYRFEYVTIDSTTLTATPDKGQKNYFLNHLNLASKIIAADGFNIVANFEVFPGLQYPASQVGTDFGSNTTQYSLTAGNNQGAAHAEVNQLYFNWNHEYGALVAGRIPFQFGLGITHNAGNGLYDHWLETHDVVGYKFLIGNLSIMPLIGKTYHAYNYAAGAATSDQMWDINYTNAETESTFAIMQIMRSSEAAGSDGAIFFKPNDTGTPVTTSGWNTKLSNIYISRGWESFKFKMEAGFVSGGSGVKYSGGTNEISVNGYAVALEMEFPRPESKMQWTMRMGIASGDDPRTDNFEGFYFNKNYDLAFLLFNHSLGSYDVLRTKLNHQRDSTNTVYASDRTVDEETVSNAVYLSPKFKYAVNDKWDWINAITYAQTQINPSATQLNVGTDLGFEWDSSFVYKITDKFQWMTELGIFMPGSVFKEGATGHAANTTYGFQTKAAISF